MRKNTSNLKKNKNKAFRSKKKQLKRILINREETWMARWRGMEMIKTAWNWRTWKIWADYFKLKGFVSKCNCKS